MKIYEIRSLATAEDDLSKLKLQNSDLTLGSEGHLTVTIRSYSSNVECSDYRGPVTTVASCHSVVDSMPVSIMSQLFHERGHPGAGVALTIDYRGGKQGCSFK